MNLQQEVIDFADKLNVLDPKDKVEAIQLLAQRSKFCWDCGYPAENAFDCHCTNDE